MALLCQGKTRTVTVLPETCKIPGGVEGSTKKCGQTAGIESTTLSIKEWESPFGHYGAKREKIRTTNSAGGDGLSQWSPRRVSSRGIRLTRSKGEIQNAPIG